MNDVLYPALMQLLVHTPTVLVCLVGAVLAFACWQRCPLRSILSLGGCGLLLFLTVVQPFINQYLVHARAEFGWTTARMGQAFGIVGVVMSFAYAAGLALLVAAAFVQRQPESQALRPST